jgi:formate-dependent phosphoribosylglycinamide formyltransferase (GAR transformylase)
MHDESAFDFRIVQNRISSYQRGVAAAIFFAFCDSKSWYGRLTVQAGTPMTVKEIEARSGYGAGFSILRINLERAAEKSQATNEYLLFQANQSVL